MKNAYKKIQDRQVWLVVWPGWSKTPAFTKPERAMGIFVGRKDALKFAREYNKGREVKMRVIPIVINY